MNTRKNFDYDFQDKVNFGKWESNTPELIMISAIQDKCDYIIKCINLYKNNPNFKKLTESFHLVYKVDDVILKENRDKILNEILNAHLILQEKYDLSVDPSFKNYMPIIKSLESPHGKFNLFGALYYLYLKSIYRHIDLRQNRILALDAIIKNKIHFKKKQWESLVANTPQLPDESRQSEKEWKNQWCGSLDGYIKTLKKKFKNSPMLFDEIILEFKDKHLILFKNRNRSLTF